MKKLENKCMLITYSDSIGHNLADLNEILDKYFKNAVGGIHILPFFPSSGDRGFAPMDYHKVDPAFGDWDDVEHLKKYGARLMKSRSISTVNLRQQNVLSATT